MADTDTDTILCHDKADAHKVIDNLGTGHIADWEFLEGGKIKLILDCKVADL